MVAKTSISIYRGVLFNCVRVTVLSTSVFRLVFYCFEQKGSFQVQAHFLEICSQELEAAQKKGCCPRMWRASAGFLVPFQVACSAGAASGEMPQGPRVGSQLDMIFLQMGSGRGWKSNSRVAASGTLWSSLKFGACWVYFTRGPCCRMKYGFFLKYRLKAKIDSSARDSKLISPKLTVFMG